MSGIFYKLAAVLAVGGLATAVGCGGGSSSGQAQLRVLHGALNEPGEDVLVDSKVVASSLAYGANTGYLSVNSGSRHVQVEPSGTTTPIYDQTLSLTGSTETTVILEGTSTPFTGLVLTDDNTAPASGTAMVRVVNAAPSMGNADVYIVPAGSSLTGVSPTIANLALGSTSGYQNLTISTTAGASNLFEGLFTQPGTTLTFLTTGSFSLTSGQIRTVVGLNSQNGGFMATTLADLD
jgi:hypothetical protein